MQHIEKSFRKGEYTALAGTAETLTRYRIFRRDRVWVAVPLIQRTTRRDPAKSSLTFDTLREMDAHFVEISKVGEFTCDACGYPTDSVMGCPDGREVCNDCFDGGIG